MAASAFALLLFVAAASGAAASSVGRASTRRPRLARSKPDGGNHGSPDNHRTDAADAHRTVRSAPVDNGCFAQISGRLARTSKCTYQPLQHSQGPGTAAGFIALKRATAPRTQTRLAFRSRCPAPCRPRPCRTGRRSPSGGVRLWFSAQRNGDHRLGLGEQQLALFVTVLIAPFETRKIWLAGLEGLGRLKCFDPECEGRIGGNIVVGKHAKAVSPHKFLRRLFAEHGVAVQKDDARLERLLGFEFRIAPRIERFDGAMCSTGTSRRPMVTTFCMETSEAGC
jgi:hypothetical protein